jgi:hypothetical protein
MGKLILLPGVDLDPPSRAELVEEAAELMLKEVTAVFIEQQFEPGPLGVWHHYIRDYFWRTEIKLEERDFREKDLRRWRQHWRNQALEFIESKRVR